MSNRIFDLTGKTAIVTGGTGHLGISICTCLALAGANVYMTGRTSKKTKKISSQLSDKLKKPISSSSLDITSSSSIDKCFNQIFKKHGSIDILVNAAFFSSSKNLTQITNDDWIKGIEGTINSTFRIIKSVIPYMEKNSSGSVINFSSIYGIISPDPKVYENTGFGINSPDYGAGKAAIIQLTKYAAVQYAKKGIRFNVISPGAFPNKTIQKNKKFIKNLKNKIPLGRIGNPADLDGIIIYLSSNSSEYMTGQNIVIDGGWTLV